MKHAAAVKKKFIFKDKFLAVLAAAAEVGLKNKLTNVIFLLKIAGLIDNVVMLEQLEKLMKQFVN